MTSIGSNGRVRQALMGGAGVLALLAFSATASSAEAQTAAAGKPAAAMPFCKAAAIACEE